MALEQEEISASVTPNGGKQISNASGWANSTNIPTGKEIATTWSDLAVGFASRVIVAAGSGSVVSIGSGSGSVAVCGGLSVIISGKRVLVDLDPPRSHGW